MSPKVCQIMPDEQEISAPKDLGPWITELVGIGQKIMPISTPDIRAEKPLVIGGRLTVSF